MGQAEATRKAQEAAEEAEKAAQEAQANLAALNQAVLDNTDARSWAGSIAYSTTRERRLVVERLRSLADDMTKAADKLEGGGRISHLWWSPRSVFDIVESLAKLEALEDTLEGPLAEAIKSLASRYDY